MLIACHVAKVQCQLGGKTFHSRAAWLAVAVQQHSASSIALGWSKAPFASTAPWPFVMKLQREGVQRCCNSNNGDGCL
jgi:hypothetical protein